MKPVNGVHTSLFGNFVPLIHQNKLKIHPFSLGFSEFEKASISDNQWSVQFKLGVCIVCANNMKVFAGLFWFDFQHRISNKNVLLVINHIKLKYLFGDKRCINSLANYYHFNTTYFWQCSPFFFFLYKFLPCINRGGGALKFGFGRDVPMWNLKVDPYKYQLFKKKWPIHTNQTNFGPNFEQNNPIFTNFIPRGWFCYPCRRHVPAGSLYWVTPGGGGINKCPGLACNQSETKKSPYDVWKIRQTIFYYIWLPHDTRAYHNLQFC